MFVISSIGSLAECVTSNLPKSLQSRHTSQSFSYIFSLLLLLHLSIQSEPYDLGINPDSVLSRRWHQSVYLKPSITVHKSINLFNFHSLLLLPPVTPPKNNKTHILPLIASYTSLKLNQAPGDVCNRLNGILSRMRHKKSTQKLSISAQKSIILVYCSLLLLLHLSNSIRHLTI